MYRWEKRETREAGDREVLKDATAEWDGTVLKGGKGFRNEGGGGGREFCWMKGV